MSTKITIDKITPEPSEGDELKNCYFEVEDGQLNFYSSNNNLLEENITVGSTFTVEVDGDEFNITVTAYTPDVSVDGTWAPADSAARAAGTEPGLGGDPTGGSFQAEAGGAVEEGTASSATA